MLAHHVVTGCPLGADAGIYPDLDCAISQAGLWLDELHHQNSYGGRTAWPEWVSGLAQGAFGRPPSLTFSSPTPG